MLKPVAWGIVLALAACSAHAAAVAEPAAVVTTAASHGGTLWVRPNPDALHALGVRRALKLPAGDEWTIPLLPREPIAVELGDGAPTRLLSGAVDLPALALRRKDGARSPALRLVPAGGEGIHFDAVDADGNVWLRITHGMRSPDIGAHGLSLLTADVRVGEALAEWAGAGQAGLLLGNARLRMPLPASVKSGQGRVYEKSCLAPNWPGTPGYVTDVMLRSIDTLDVLRCRQLPSGACDGPGGSEGEMVIVPSATLRNSTAINAADVPWYTKFSGNFAPYGNDQHPYLVWNLYRLDAAGGIEQIGRSGLKHAFATSNEQCSEPCFNSHILGRGCQDLYDASSNDYAFALAPRSEMIPSTGVWGRCMSVYDDTTSASSNTQFGCDGNQDAAPPDDLYRHRLVVRESAVDPALNAGATFLIDAWYVVRDDDAIYNTMGFRSLAPQFSGSAWNVGSAGAFVSGAVIDRWLALTPAGVKDDRVELASAEGTVVTAVRVTLLPDQRYRYDYAVMNFDFSRPVTTGAEPNLRILRNLGLSQFTLALANGATVDDDSYRDGDANAANDWTAAANAAQVAWTAPAGATLDWGRLVSFTVVSTAAPGLGQLQYAVAEAGTPSSYAMTTLVPDAAAIFRDDFE